MVGRWIPVSALVLSSFVSSAVLADGRQADETQARALFSQAREAFDAGHYPEARSLLGRSLELAPRSSTAMNLARVQRSMGDFVAADRTLVALIEGAYGAVPEKRLHEAQGLRALLRTEVGTLVVTTAGGEALKVAVDGNPLGTLNTAQSRTVPVNPGRHVIVSRTTDGRAQEQSVVVGEGATVRLRVLPPEQPEAQAESSVFASPWFWVVTGVVVAGGVAATLVLTQRDSEPADADFPTVMALTF